MATQCLRNAEPMRDNIKTKDGTDPTSLLKRDFGNGAEGGEVVFMPKRELDGVDLCLRAVGEIGDGPVFHLTVFAVPTGRQAVGLAQEVPGICFPTLAGGCGVDKHSGYEN